MLSYVARCIEMSRSYHLSGTKRSIAVHGAVIPYKQEVEMEVGRNIKVEITAIDWIPYLKLEVLLAVDINFITAFGCTKPEGKRPLGRPRRRWVDNIRMDLGEVGWSDVDWIGLAQDRIRWRALVNSVLNLRVP
jgi:hypothetical protein